MKLFIAVTARGSESNALNSPASASRSSTTWSSAGDMTTSSNLTIGSLNGTAYSACDVGQILYYNRVLTDDEIMQNYDATKNKYNYL